VAGEEGVKTTKNKILYWLCHAVKTDPFFQPIYLSGSLFTLRPYPAILAELTMNPGGRGKGLTANFSTHLFFSVNSIYDAYQGHNSH
jgi:hypothetical protein